MRHLTILCVTWPSYASLDHLIRHLTILSVTQQFCQDVDFINKFDTIWSSKWLWSIIFFSESGYLDDRTFQHMHVTVKALKDLCVFAHCRYIWICWFGRCAFVKPSILHLQTSDINASFGTSLDFSQNNLYIFNSNHLHLQTGDISTFVRDGTMVVFFTAHQLEFIRPTHFHPALPTELMPSPYWIKMFGDGWWWMKGWVIAGCLPKKIVFSNSSQTSCLNQLHSRSPCGWALSSTFSCCSQRTQHLFFPPLPGIALLSSSQSASLFRLLNCSTAWGK